MARTFIPRPAVLSALEQTYDVGANTVLVFGPPGCGKSALVEQWSHTLDERCVTVPLADVADEAALLERVAKVLGMTDHPDGVAVAHALRAAGPITVVLDDFDRAAKAGEGALDRWRDAAPLARWVVTSRQRLELDDVNVVEVGPMTREQAVQLFSTRARRARPDFVLDAEMTDVVGRLADELDCIPLAVELAAARVNALGPAEILKRLPERFRILRERGTTLQGAILVSWDLLDDWEREVLGQCVVFRGGFSARAAEAVIELPDDAPWVVDVLQGLVEKSLLRSTTPDGLVGEVRFTLMTSIREFVSGQRAPDDALRQRHAQLYLSQCREWTHQMRRAGGASARARLELDQGNLIAAFNASTQPDVVVDLALTLDKSFRLHGAHERWEQVLERARQQAETSDDTRTDLVYRAIGELHLLRGRFDAALVALEAAAVAAEANGERVTLAWTWFLRGEVERRSGKPRAAHESLRRAIELAREHGIANVERMALGHEAGCLVDLGELALARTAVDEMSRLPPSDDLRDEANLLKRVAYAQHYLGNTDEQARLTAQALELARESGDRRLEAICIQGLGDAAFVRRDFGAAREAWTEALALHRSHGSAELEGALLGNLGNLEHRVDRLDEARRAYRAALELHALTGARPYEAVVWFGLGVLEFELQHFEDAAVALGRAAEINAEIGNQSDFASCRLVQAWVAERQGVESQALREESRDAFAAAGDDDWVRLTASPTDTAGVTDETVLACARALDRADIEDRSRLHVRAALARSGRVAEPEGRAALQFARDGQWFEADGHRVNMRRRRAPRHILARLIELWSEQPGEALDVDEAFAVGWPGEIATVEAANDRVYWAIRTLRKLGLEGHLITGGDGYMLDPDGSMSVSTQLSGS